MRYNFCLILFIVFSFTFIDTVKSTAVSYEIEMIKVIDGDTMLIRLLDISGIDVEVKLRILGIDTAELTSIEPKELELSLRAKDYAEELLLGKSNLRVVNISNDKYRSRIVGDIELSNGKLFSKMMLDKNLAIQYDGKTKQLF
ncbi:MAG: thermonuclease family protein [Alphaproteobacteria bacterium]|nr:thermonuclease family protein [Alphaproteobacteria bacterium]MBL0718074.1 thermonuclease family protein [Alphaproteobacteria bacterium]